MRVGYRDRRRQLQCPRYRVWPVCEGDFDAVRIRQFADVMAVLPGDHRFTPGSKARDRQQYAKVGNIANPAPESRD